MECRYLIVFLIGFCCLANCGKAAPTSEPPSGPPSGSIDMASNGSGSLCGTCDANGCRPCPSTATLSPSHHMKDMQNNMNSMQTQLANGMNQMSANLDQNLNQSAFT